MEQFPHPMYNLPYMKTQRVKKVVIPVAGYGTRFLPATKAMPKEMLPVLNKPVIQYVVEEAVKSGIEDVILVTSGMKRAVEDHFDENEMLAQWLIKTGKREVLKEVRRVARLANFIYIRQKGPYGNVIPVLNAESVLGGEPFAVLWGDEVITGKTPRLKQLMETYETYGHPVIAVVPVDPEQTKRYGVIDPKRKIAKGVYELKGMVEKPGPEKAPSLLASIGGYILTPDIFGEIRRMKPGHGGEYVLLDAIKMLMKKRPIYAREISGEFLDTGTPLKWLKANLKVALERPDMKAEVKRMLRQMK
jgi:UTP--glucose-1-phosphate uridylyltransferase